MRKETGNGLTTNQKYLKDYVYGASDGIVTTFAIVAGVAGAGLAPVIVLILGFANLIADGFSMAVGNYLSRKSEKEFETSERKKILGLIDSNPKSQKYELEKIFLSKGFEGKLLKDASVSIMKDKNNWADCIMKEGLGLVEESGNPVKNGMATFGAFVIAGFMPLLAFVLAAFNPELMDVAFQLAIVFTAAALITVGMLKSSVTKRIWWKESGQMLFLGGAAAALAYLVGYLISTII